MKTETDITERYVQLVATRYGDEIGRELRARIGQHNGEWTPTRLDRTLQDILSAQLAARAETTEAIVGAAFSS